MEQDEQEMTCRTNESEEIRDEKGNIKKEILDKMVDKFIDKNPLIYQRLAEI